MIPPGLRRAGEAMRYLERRQEAVAHNLANASTPGFRGERVFARVLEGVTPEAHAATDRRGGAMSATGRPLDLALGPEGFLVVETADGERWVRGGSFTLDPDGRVTDEGGNPLQGEGGALVLPPGQIEIRDNGEVLVDGERVDRLRMEAPLLEGTLQRENAGRFVPPEAAERTTPPELRVRAGYLEESNVEPVGTMVEMMTIQRNYTTLQRSIQVMDGVLGTIANELGRVE